MKRIASLIVLAALVPGFVLAQQARLSREYTPPNYVLDVADYPTSFSEAPDLAAKVAAGELPPVEERLPVREDLLVVEGGSIGTYGGSIVMSTLGSTEALNRNASAFDKFIFWDPSGSRLVPALAKSWEQSDDARSVTLYLREGLKWSDGHPLTTEDVRFWYEDVYRNTEIQPEPEPGLTPDGVPARLVIIDDYTLRWEFDEPYWTFPEQMACPFCPIGRGFTLGFWLPGGPVAPAHYMKQFHPAYAGQDAVDKMAADAELESWVSLYGNKMNWGLNADLPVITPYKTVEGNLNASALWRVERNPYFYAVDSAGNQLPYIDSWELPKVETGDMVYLRLAGRQDDFNWRLPKLDQVPFMLANKDRGNYDVYFDYANAGSASMISINRTWRGDPEIEALLNAADFRRAVSLGIDREQYNEAWMLGLAVPGSPVVADHHPMNPGPEYRTLWHTYDPDRANELLDGLGLTERDSDGFRLTPGGNRVTISLAVVQSHPDWVGQTEIFVEEMKELDLDIKLDVLADEMSGQWRATNQYQFSWGANWGSEDFWGGGAPAAGLPVTNIATNGLLWGVYYETQGEKGEAPDPETAADVLKVWELYDKGRVVPAEERYELGQEIWKILIEEVWMIGIAGQVWYHPRVLNNQLANAAGSWCVDGKCRYPGSSHPELWYWASSKDM